MRVNRTCVTKNSCYAEWSDSFWTPLVRNTPTYPHFRTNLSTVPILTALVGEFPGSSPTPMVVLLELECSKMTEYTEAASSLFNRTFPL